MLQHTAVAAAPAEVDERYPRPQLVRSGWIDLCGDWQYTADPEEEGLREGWHVDPEPYDRTIVVPFPPESAMSGIGDPSTPAVVWYRREVDITGVCSASDRLVLRFGAVDYRATVWVDGARMAVHEGGHTPFSVDVTDVLAAGSTSMCVVVRVEDRPDDAAQPRGKQTWQSAAAGLYHPRTSGIWQPVWLERVPALAVERITWTPDVSGGRVQVTVELTQVPRRPVTLSVVLSLPGEVLAEQAIRVADPSISFDVAIPAATDGRQLSRLLWSPETPTLLDAAVRLLDGDDVLDEVGSYLGFRSVGVADGAFLLNDRPYPLRAVLAQGFWPQSHLAAPSAEALRHEAELIKELGFNGVRLHQKVEDPRFLQWCDRLGLLVWAEMPSAFSFTPKAVQRLTCEWLEVLRRDAAHPSIVTWVPFNESWGVPHVAAVPAQQQFVRALAALTRAVDPSRPVVSNDGWEHVDSDIVTIHDYAVDPRELGDRYGDAAEVVRLVEQGRPWLRRVCVPGHLDRAQPVVLSEFGGVISGVQEEGGWGYATVHGAEQYRERLTALFSSVRTAAPLAGYCYTQLTDTATEANGLLDAQRRPKLPMEQLRTLITGQSRPNAAMPVSGGAQAPELIALTG